MIILRYSATHAADILGAIDLVRDPPGLDLLQHGARALLDATELGGLVRTIVTSQAVVDRIEGVREVTGVKFVSD